jgi:outer membrane receptor protein involved in Fe transport
LLSAVDSGSVVRGTGRSLVSTVNLQGGVRKPLRWGVVFETNVGTNITTTNTHDLIGSGLGIIPGTNSLAGATRVFLTEGEANTSVFGWYIEPHLTGQRFALSTGIRLDGGSAYGARVTRTGGGLLGLPKLNGSWVVSEEPWFPFKGAFSSLRLRGAYGQAQVQPGVTDHLRLYTDLLDPSGAQLTLTTLGNTKLRPERSTEFEGGFDADVLDNRVSLELTAYRKLQVDALMNMALPGSVDGGGSQLTNIGNIRNRGLELTLRLTPIRLPALTWSAQVNYSQNSNLLVKLGSGVLENRAQGIVEGFPVGGRWARPILGFADQNGNGVLQREEIQVGDSLVYMGRLLPASTSALFTNLVLFGGAVGVTAGFSYTAGETQIDQTLRTNWVLERALVDPSVPFSQQAAVLASTTGSNPTDYGLMQEVSTLRFTSLSVNYRAPGSVARLLRAQQLTVAIQGSNLGLHSTYHGKDPDVTAWGPGETVVDTGQLPQPRIWQLAVFLAY